jgi:hypothetical protein
MNASGNNTAKTALSVLIILINDDAAGDFGHAGATILQNLFTPGFISGFY